MSDASSIVDPQAIDHRPHSDSVWLFSPKVDVAVFGGSAAVAMLALWVGDLLGVLHADSPEWTWISAILLIDVAHVYATTFRVYFDVTEFRRRRSLYLMTPLLCFAIGVAVYSESSDLFWRLLAYMAVFHFVRQQYGWVALYRSKAREDDRFGWWVDASAIYLASVYPLIHWHAYQPRNFHWFLPGDFGHIPGIIESIARPVYWCVMVGYFTRAAVRAYRDQSWNLGKDLVVLTTAICWYVGIISFNSDYAFTVTNVIIHGVPYFAIVFVFQQHQLGVSGESRSHTGTSQNEPHAKSTDSSRAVLLRRFTIFMATLWLFAYIEELLWDRAVWDERSWLFGDWHPGGPQSFWVPLLAVPQVTHYVLDGFIWRRRSNDGLKPLTQTETQT